MQLAPRRGLRSTLKCLLASARAKTGLKPVTPFLAGAMAACLLSGSAAAQFHVQSDWTDWYTFYQHPQGALKISIRYIDFVAPYGGDAEWRVENTSPWAFTMYLNDVIYRCSDGDGDRSDRMLLVRDLGPGLYYSTGGLGGMCHGRGEITGVNAGWELEWTE